MEFEVSLVPNMFNAMKQIAENVFEARRPADWYYGSFKVGDKLILLRKQGGQEYLILDKKGAL